MLGGGRSQSLVRKNWLCFSHDVMTDLTKEKELRESGPNCNDGQCQILYLNLGIVGKNTNGQ